MMFVRLLMLGLAVLPMTLTACGKPTGRSKASTHAKNSFHLQISGCGSKPMVFEKRAEFCSWLKEDAGKACFDQLSADASEGHIGSDLFHDYCEAN